MTPSVASSLLEVLADALAPDTGPVDGLLRRYFRAHPVLGRRDRGDIAETVFDVLRNRRLYAHLAQSGQGRAERRLVLLSWQRRGLLQAFSADLARTAAAGSSARGARGRRPAAPGAGGAGRRGRAGDGPRFDPPTTAEHDWLEQVARIDPSSLPAAVAVSLPDWLWRQLADAWGDADASAIARALLAPAPLDLRANLLKSDRDRALAALAADGLVAQPLALAPTALRVEGKPALERSAAFTDGLVEVQDAGSQLLALLAGPRRGQTVVDFCAGAGGKALAMAAAMRSTGQIYACDVSAARLARLRPRLARAAVTNVQPFAIDRETDPKLDRLAGRADVVLVDAPCSGTGTLRRNPDLKWRLAEADVAQLAVRQQAILGAAARLVRPGGALVYATCSLLPAENEAVATAFEAAHPRFRRDAPGERLARADAVVEPLLSERSLVLRPDLHGCDGFYAVRWTLGER